MEELLKEIIGDYDYLMGEGYCPEEALKLMEIESKWGIAAAIRDCFESNNRLPNIPEAIVMAGDTISRELSNI